MSDTINNNVAEQIRAYNELDRFQSLRKEIQRDEQVRIASMKQAVQHERDTVNSAVGLKGNETNESEKNAYVQKPILMAPQKAFGSETMHDPETQGIISLIGKVLMIQALCNSNTYKNLFQQASQAMEIQVKFAPLIGSSIQQSYNKMADATSQDASKEMWTGVLNFVGFGAAIGLGVIGEIKEPSTLEKDAEEGKSLTKANEDELNQFDPSKLEQKAQNAENQAARDAQQSAKSAKQEENETQKAAAAQNAENKKSDWEKFNEKASKLGRKLKSSRVAGAIDKASQRATMAQMFTAGPIGIASAQYDSNKSQDQKDQGAADATSKEAEQYAQYFGQAFTRAEDLRNGSQQNIDSTTNMLNQLSNTVTQTVTSMFRG